MPLLHVYGDSNSAVWGGTPNPGTPWTSRFATRLAGDALGPTRLANRAIGGQRMHFCRGQAAVPGSVWPAIETYGIDDLAQAEAAARLPNRVLLCAGTNDIPAESTPDAELPDLWQAFDTFAQTITDRWGIPVHVLSVLPMRVTGMVSNATWQIREPRRRALNQHLRTVFAGQGRFIDLDPVLCQQPDLQLRPEFAWTDGLHVSAQAHLAISDSLPLSLGA